MPWSIFQTNGPIIEPNSPVYIERVEDENILRLVKASKYVTVLGAPQTGKTSLLYRLRQRISENYIPVVINLAAADSTGKEEEWYQYLCRRILAQINSESSVYEYASSKIEFVEFLSRTALGIKPTDRIVIMLDDFGTIPRSVADGFFSTLRSVYNERGVREVFQKYVFILAGLTDSRELVDVKRVSSPFNVSEKIYMSDLDEEGTEKLVSNLEKIEDGRFKIEIGAYDYIHQLTGGHPNLIQKICAILERFEDTSISRKSIDLAVELLIAEGDDNIYWIQEQIDQDEEIRNLVKKIMGGKDYKFDRSIRLHLKSELIGAIRRGNDGMCKIRNEIYAIALSNYFDFSV